VAISEPDGRPPCLGDGKEKMVTQQVLSKYIIAVASGKGGVGKSTVAVNLAVSLAKTGAAVGLLDADIHGPNIPIMMGVRAEPQRGPTGAMLPLERYGVKLMSVGFLPGGNKPVIWRGPLIGKILKQFLAQVDWGNLDYLFVDMPPGTGDAQITLSQAVALTGAVIVSTPQDVALEDALKGVGMFQTMAVPILGLIENMSYFLCPCCGTRTEIFAHGGTRKASQQQRLPFLGELPLDPKIRLGGDQGVPIVIAEPDSVYSTLFSHMCQQLLANIHTMGVTQRARVITIQ
jgi:ATP-binding protein involved in chromosome partitioning